MAHKSSLVLFMALYFILSLIIGPVRSCTISTPWGSIHHCSHVTLVTCYEKCLSCLYDILTDSSMYMYACRGVGGFSGGIRH